MPVVDAQGSWFVALGNCSYRTLLPLAVPAAKPVNLNPHIGRFAVGVVCPSTASDWVIAADKSASRAFQSAVVAEAALVPGFQLDAGAV
jgi:hypothetical protein